MPYIGQRPATGEANSFKILDDISNYTLTFGSSDIDVSADTITAREHRFVTGQRVTYGNGGGTDPTGLSNGTVYYIIVEDRHTFKLATNASNAVAGTAINITAAGAGAAHTINVAFDGVNTKFKATHTNGTKADISQSGQLMVSVNGVLQQPHDNTTTPTTGYATDHTSTIIFSAAPAAGDQFFGRLIASNFATFDISDNTVDNFTGDGSTSTFTLSKTPPNNESILVTIDGVVQYPDDNAAVRAYTVSENVLDFASAPGNAVEIQVRHIGFAGASTAAVSGFYGRTGNAVLKNTDDIVFRNANVGVVTATDIRITGNLTVDGTTTTLDTDLIGVDKLEVSANNTTVAAAITQTGSGDILNLYDGSTEVVSVLDGGAVRIGGNAVSGAAAGVVLQDGTGVIATRSSGSSPVFRGYTQGDSSANFTVKADGKLLLGTETEGISGAHNLTIGESGHGGITIRTGTTSAGAIYFADSTSGDAQFDGFIQYNQQTRYLRFGTAQAERLRIDAAGRIGIGTDNPQVQLHLTAADPYIRFQDTAAPTGHSQIMGTHQGALVLSADESGSVADSHLRFDVDGTERLRVSSNGAVCIGDGYKSSGGGQLTIRGLGVNSYAVQDYQYVGTPSSNNTLAQIRFTANTSGSSVIGGARIQAAADADWSAAGDAPTRLQFYTTPNGSASQLERLRILSTGTVNIGDQGLADEYLGSTVKIRKDQNSVTRLSLRNENSGSGSASAIQVGAYGNSWMLQCGSAANDSNAFTIRVDGSANSNTGTEKLRLTTAGNMGVGNVDPTQARLVAQVASGVSIAAVKDNTGASISLGGVTQPRILMEAGASASEFKLYTAGGSSYGSASWTERLRIDSDGRLFAKGAAATNAWSGGDDLVIGNTNSGTRTGITLVSHSGSDGGIYWSDGTGINVYRGQIAYNHANDTMSLYTAAAARLRITSGGIVLINDANVSTNRADAPLQIETGANGNALNLRARSGDNIYSYLNFQNNAGSQTAAHIYLQRDASTNAGTLVFGTASANANTPTERFTIRSDGRIAIGTQTINTDSMLSIHRSSSDQSQVRFTNTTTGEGGNNGLIVGIDNNEHGRIFNMENNPLRLGTNNTERFRISSGGFVSIGGNYTQTNFTTQVTRIGGDTDVMQVKGNVGNAFIRFADNDATSDFTLGSDDGSGAGAGAFILYDRNNTVYRVVVNSSGNIGIRNTNPSSKVHIGDLIGSASNDANTTHTSLIIKQTNNDNKSGFYIERSGERKGYYMWMNPGGGSGDGLTFTRNNNGTKSDAFILDRDANLWGGGTFYPLSDNAYDLGSSSNRWRNVYTTDLQLSNEGSQNDVDGTWGSYTIQEGEDELFLINRRNGKKYKFNLTEVN